ncbi:MAG: hypothetical protein ACP5F3_04910 [Candidatus Syntrophosphaera sp.]
MKQLLAMIAFLGCVAMLFAHPASNIDASYSAQNKTLTISFDHKVGDPADHFIQGVEVRLNDRMIISQVNTAQDSETGGTFIYRIPNLRKNDVIKVTLICNKTGKRSASMILK